jgi:hypothetical protein
VGYAAFWVKEVVAWKAHLCAVLAKARCVTDPRKLVSQVGCQLVSLDHKALKVMAPEPRYTQDEHMYYQYSNGLQPDEPYSLVLPPHVEEIPLA